MSLSNDKGDSFLLIVRANAQGGKIYKFATGMGEQREHSLINSWSYANQGWRQATSARSVSSKTGQG